MLKAAKKRAKLRATKRRLESDAIPRKQLAAELQRRIKYLGLNRNEAAAVVKDAASQMSRLMTGYITDFSADRIVKMLLRTGCDVHIAIRPRESADRKRAMKRGRVKIVRIPYRV